MMRLKGHRVLFVDPAVTWLAPLRDKSAKQSMAVWRNPPKRDEANPHIEVIAQPPIAPFYNKYRAINRRNQKRLAGYLRRRLAEAGMENPLLWAYTPTAADILGHLPHSGVVYDCIDRHAGYPGFVSPAIVDAMDEELARKASAVFTTANGLYERLSPLNPRTALVPNGVNYELFANAPMQPLNDKPTFGFSGKIQQCTDIDVVAYAAKARPDWQFLFLGDPLPGVDTSALANLPNVKVDGFYRPYEQMPAELAKLDVCLNLYRRDNALAWDVSPLKLPEYLASGNPVVSTAFNQAALQYADVIEIADGPESFVAACERALDDKCPERRAKRRAYAKACSWEARVAEMERRLKEWNVMV
jgi:glycosyltransferase involved in cell wall biosynthesis